MGLCSVAGVAAADGGAELVVDRGVGIETDGSFVQSNVQNGVFISEMKTVAALTLSYSGEFAFGAFGFWSL